MDYVVTPIGRVESTLVDPALAPRQGDEGGPEAWLVFEPGVRDGLRGLSARTDVLVLTWLDLDGTPIVDVKPILGAVDER
jgi:tRNA (Thr-GGU) A37 N-methylase